MYTLKIHKKAVKFFKSRSISERGIIKIKLDFLTENPYSHPQLDIKKLKGDEEVFRLRVGKIRIIYQIINNDLIVFVISAGSRGDIYKKKT
jgi:mRNA interferase RelE/StbE